MAGKDVVQIYLHGAEGPLERPDRELIAFQKTRLLAPGETQTLLFSVPFRTMAVYNEKKAAWLLQRGTNVLYLGENARDNAAFFTFDTEESILEQVSNQAEPHHTRPLRQLSKLDPQGTKPIAPPIRAMPSSMAVKRPAISSLPPCQQELPLISCGTSRKGAAPWRRFSLRRKTLS